MNRFLLEVATGLALIMTVACSDDNHQHGDGAEQKNNPAHSHQSID